MYCFLESFRRILSQKKPMMLRGRKCLDSSRHCPHAPGTAVYMLPRCCTQCGQSVFLCAGEMLLCAVQDISSVCEGGGTSKLHALPRISQICHEGTN